jgi:surface antigen
MNTKSMLLAAAAVFALGVAPALAQSDVAPDPNGYYSENDHEGYYDREGHYHRFDRDRSSDSDRSYPDRADNGDNGPPLTYYREGEYEHRCKSGTAAGTVFGAAGGGLIGGAASHGNPAAIVGGVLLGGLFGNAISRDINCDDQRYAFNVYADGLNGEIGRRYEWRHGDSYGYFTPTREFADNGDRCRAFTTATYRNGEEYHRDGVACYGHDGNWHFRDA